MRSVGLLEQIDRRRRIEREHRRLHRGGEPRVDFVEGEQDVDGLRLELRQDLAEAGQLEAEKLARKHEKFAQQIEALEHPMIVGKQRILALEADLLQALARRRMDDGIAEVVEIAEIDAPAMRKQLLVERDRIRFRARRNRAADWWCGSRRTSISGFFERLGVGRLVLRARRRRDASTSAACRPAHRCRPTRPSACSGAGDGKYSAPASSNGQTVMSPHSR